jgi:hypothetical protein
MSAAPAHRSIVHFVGSVPLPNAQAVFRSLAAARITLEAPAGRRDRIRKTWIRFPG